MATSLRESLAMERPTSPPVSLLQRMGYPGGKGGSGVYQRLINLMPPHRVYVEPFLGGGAVMRLKRPAAVNVGIDLDADAVALCRSSIAPSSDGAGVIAAADDGGRWRWVVGDGIEFLQATEWGGDELVYCDPPYMHHTRARRDRYRHEMTDRQHADLLSVLRSLPCMVLISGYWSELYADTLAAWSRASFQAMTRGGHTATEHVWFNYSRPVALHDYRYLGDTFRERERAKRKRSRWVRRLSAMPPLERQALLGALFEVSQAAADSPAMAMPAGDLVASPIVTVCAAAALADCGDAGPGGHPRIRRWSPAGIVAVDDCSDRR